MELCNEVPHLASISMQRGRRIEERHSDSKGGLRITSGGDVVRSSILCNMFCSANAFAACVCPLALICWSSVASLFFFVSPLFLAKEITLQNEGPRLCGQAW